MLLYRMALEAPAPVATLVAVLDARILDPFHLRYLARFGARPHKPLRSAIFR